MQQDVSPFYFASQHIVRQRPVHDLARATLPRIAGQPGHFIGNNPQNCEPRRGRFADQRNSQCAGSPPDPKSSTRRSRGSAPASRKALCPPPVGIVAPKSAPVVHYRIDATNASQGRIHCSTHPRASTLCGIVTESPR